MRKNLVIIGIVLIIIGIILFASSTYIAASSIHYKEISLKPNQAYTISEVGVGLLMYKSNISAPVKLIPNNVSLTASGQKDAFYAFVVQPTNDHAIVEMYNNYTEPIQIQYANIPATSEFLVSGVLILLAIILAIAGIVIAIYGAVKK